MNKTPIIRWFLFLTIGMPFQAIVYLLYPLIWVYWRVFIFKKAEKTLPQHWEPDFEVGRKTKLNGTLLANNDDHGAMTQYGFVEAAGLNYLIDKDGNLARAIGEDFVQNMKRVSGDCVVAWAFAYVMIEKNIRPVGMARKVAWNYLKNLGSLSWDEKNSGDVSNRCNNFGINYCPDSDTWGIGQPAAGPQFYTNSCLFAIASQGSVFWKLVFWAHWFLMGGWYWAFWPSVYPADKLWYVRDIVMKSLWVHKEIFGDRWWISMPMKKVNESVPVRNDLFEAMIGNEPGPMPEVMHAFFSQLKSASSEKASFQRNDRASAHIKKAIWAIYEKARK